MSSPNIPNIDELSEQDLTLISAYLDNQLDNAELTAFKKRLLQEPTLNAQCQQFKKMDEQIKQQISSIDNTPIPANISQLLSNPDDKTTIQQNKHNNTNSSSKTSNPTRILALAATIAAVGILSYQTLMPQIEQSTDAINNQSNIITQAETSSHQMVSPLVHNALSQSLSMEITKLGAEGKMVVLQSFYNTQGQPCREYQLAQNAQTKHAIACYEQQKWTNVVDTFKSNQTNSQQYQTANTQNPIQITTYIENIKEPNTINKRQEQLLINSNWLLTEN